VLFTLAEEALLDAILMLLLLAFCDAFPLAELLAELADCALLEAELLSAFL
jgi:hypothetical protein